MQYVENKQIIEEFYISKFQIVSFDVVLNLLTNLFHIQRIYSVLYVCQITKHKTVVEGHFQLQW